MVQADIKKSMALHYLLVVNGAAYGTQQASSAYQFACELIQHHHLNAVFFMQNGVYNANRFISPASDEFNLVNAWEKLADHHQIPLHFCISAAQRRGIVFENDNIELLSPAFTISSLSEFASLLPECDRLIQF